jgi:hypothetical protein
MISSSWRTLIEARQTQRPILPVYRRGILHAGDSNVDICTVHDVVAATRALQPAAHYLLDTVLSCGDVFSCCSPAITRCGDSLAETAAVLTSMSMRDDCDMAVIINDIYTKEYMEILLCAGALPAERVMGVETGGANLDVMATDAKKCAATNPSFSRT